MVGDLLAGGDLSADHRTNELVGGEVGRARGTDLLAVSKHRHPVRKVEDLRQPMADEDDGRALVPEPADRRENALDLVVGQRGGRLIEDEDPGAAHYASGDLDELLFGQRQLPCRLVEIDVAEADRVELLANLRGVAAPKKELADAIVSHEHVVEDCQVGNYRQLLVDDRDQPRIGAMAGRESGAVHEDLALRGRDQPAEDFHEGALSGAVFAAEPMHLAGRQLEVHLFEGDNAAVGLAKAFDVENSPRCLGSGIRSGGSGHGFLLLACLGSRVRLWEPPNHPSDLYSFHRTRKTAASEKHFLAHRKNWHSSCVAQITGVLTAWGLRDADVADAKLRGAGLVPPRDDRADQPRWVLAA